MRRYSSEPRAGLEGREFRSTLRRTPPAHMAAPPKKPHDLYLEAVSAGFQPPG
jgi:hypothetical protein